MKFKYLRFFIFYHIFFHLRGVIAKKEGKAIRKHVNLNNIMILSVKKNILVPDLEKFSNI